MESSGDNANGKEDSSAEEKMTNNVKKMNVSSNTNETDHNNMDGATPSASGKVFNICCE